MATRQLDRLQGALLGTALGDAVGAPFEGRHGIATREVEAWLASSAQLRWTDDTHMAMTLAQVLRDTDGSLDTQRLGDAFAVAYESEPWRGYGAGPPQVFALARGGMTYLEAAGSLFSGSGSFGNGAAMRVAPVALAARGDVNQAAALAETQARVTHTHAEAVDGAVFVATAACVLASGTGDRAEVIALLPRAADLLPSGRVRAAITEIIDAARAGEDPAAVAHDLGTGVAARESVPAAVAAVLVGEDVTSTLVAAVLLGGDTDTIAAMAGAMAGARYGASSIPDRLLARLEDRETLDELASTLLTQGEPDHTG